MKKSLLCIGVFLSSALVCRAEPRISRTLIVENEDVKVWRTTIPPNVPLDWHRHNVHRVVVPLMDVRLKKAIQGQHDLIDLNWDFRQAYWYDSDPPNQLHSDVNESGKTMEVIVIELKKTASDQPSEHPAAP